MLFLRDFMMPFMRTRVAKRFANEGDEASGAWLPLADATEDIRNRQGFPGDHPINRRTGELENFMRRGVVDFAMQPNASSMFFPGTPPRRSIREKLKTAQRGRSRAQNFLGLGATPARPVAAVSMADMSFFMNSFSFWFGKEVQEKMGSPVRVTR